MSPLVHVVQRAASRLRLLLRLLSRQVPQGRAEPRDLVIVLCVCLGIQVEDGRGGRGQGHSDERCLPQGFLVDFEHFEFRLVALVSDLDGTVAEDSLARIGHLPVRALVEADQELQVAAGLAHVQAAVVEQTLAPALVEHPVHVHECLVVVRVGNRIEEPVVIAVLAHLKDHNFRLHVLDQVPH